MDCVDYPLRIGPLACGIKAEELIEGVNMLFGSEECGDLQLSPRAWLWCLHHRASI